MAGCRRFLWSAALAIGGPVCITRPTMRVLFITATRIGDAVLSTGLLSHLVERHPAARFTIAAGPAAAPLFEAVPPLEPLLVVAQRRWSLHRLCPSVSVVPTPLGHRVALRGPPP